MTIYKAAIADKKFIGAKIRSVSVSGTVKVDGVGVERDITVFKMKDLSHILGTTVSDSSGNFSVIVNGGSSNYVTVICSSNSSDENSSIFAQVSLAD